MRILIIGGTGTLGRAVIEHYAGGLRDHLTCLSRDEFKQQQLKRDFPFVKCLLGDVRDGIPNAHRYDLIYHLAALKHIDILERNVTESIKTNVLGSIKAAEMALASGVPRFVFSSTDKAVFPVNAYGYSKALAEKYLLDQNRDVSSPTTFKVFRWGNVVGSRGSVVHAFVESLASERPFIRLTAPEMTRFWIRIEDAVKFMVSEAESVACGGLHIPEMKAASVLDLASVIAERLGVESFTTELIGLRPGEKMHEHITETLSSFEAPKYTRVELHALLKGIV